MKITVSVIKADVGGIGGHTRPSDGLIDAVKKTVEASANLLIDYYIGYCGDDVHIVMSHRQVLKLHAKKDCMVQARIS
jgi:fructose 1,6-bisphosphate aldolase/phosphatase